MPVASEFIRRYPGTEVELKTSDRKVNVYENEVDVAIRIRELPDSGLRVRRLGALRIVVFGARTYFERHGRPREPAELVRHRCVIRRSDPDGEKWAFRVRGKAVSYRVAGPFSTDDANAVQEAVVHGLGLGRAPVWQIRAQLEQGRVETVLEDFEPAKLPVFAVSPPAKLPIAKTKLFVDLLAARVKRELV